MSQESNISSSISDQKNQGRKSLVHIRDAHKAFGKNEVLKGVNLDLYEDEILVIVGKSGCGKSVLIKCMVRLMELDSGELTVLDQAIADLDQDELDHIRTDIGFLFQGSALYDSMTVRENLLFPLRRHKQKMKDFNEDELVLEALQNVGLESAIDLLPSELSGGMKRRIALARTLILKPKIILYDEPTSGLDPITSKEIINLMLRIQEKYKTSSLIITHDMDCARFVADRMIILHDGINFAEGSFQELSTSPDKTIKAFFK